MKEAVCYNPRMTEKTNTAEDQIDLTNAIVGIPLAEWEYIVESITKARAKTKEAYLAANAAKKQRAIAEAHEILEELFVDG